MEMRGMNGHTGRFGLRAFCVTLLLLAWSFDGFAQPKKIYTVKNGNMYIELSKWLSPASVDSFISQYHLQDLKLKECLFQGFSDSLISMGWRIASENANSIVITKPLFGADEWNSAVGKIRMTQKDRPWDWSPLGPNIVYGINRFHHKNTFEIKDDSIVVFFLRGRKNARRVMLAGSFNDWAPDALPMTKTDSGWIAYVTLHPGKYWYKFIPDGHWIVDEDNAQQDDDGDGNTNSIYYKTNSIFRLAGFHNAKKVFLTGSFNDWNDGELEMKKTATGWELPLFLIPGTHTYRFIVDGKWLSDPANVNKLPNEFGEFNSVIQLGKPSLFTLPGFPNAKKVVLAGSFNNWRKDELFLVKTATGWEIPYILGPGNYEYTFVVDGQDVPDPANPVRVWRDNKNPSFLAIQPNHTFRLKGYAKAKRVYLAGDFNDWEPDNMVMKREGDEWVFTVHLSPGKHLYKFIVDGEWIIDPGNALWEQNEHNTGNSVIWIGEQ